VTEEATMQERIAALITLHAQHASAQDVPIFVSWIERLQLAARTTDPAELDAEAAAIAEEAEAHAEVARAEEKRAREEAERDAPKSTRRRKARGLARLAQRAADLRPARGHLTMPEAPSSPEAARRRSSLFVRVALALQFGVID
jgi:hypothetical protein